MQIDCFPDGIAFFNSFKENTYKIAFVDIFMEKMNGIAVAEKLREKDRNILIVFVTTSPDFMFLCTQIMGKRIRISSESLNCFGTWVKTDGIDYGQYQQNPLLLYMHRRGEIIGSIKDFRVEGKDVTGEPYFDEVRDESKILKQQFDKDTLKMCSPFFEVIETSDAPELLKPGQTRPTVTKCKLLEVSMVDMGGNVLLPNAGCLVRGDGRASDKH